MHGALELPPFPEETKQRIFNGINGRVPILNLLGIRLLDIEPGRARLFLPFRPELTRGDGVVQGGIVTTLADTSIAHAALAALFPDATTNTIELKMNFMRPGTTDLTCESWLIHKGRRTIVGESAVSDAGGKLVAKCLSAVMVMPHTSPLERYK
jgi:uncharacterized protein (TIGR00369 family)